MPNTGKKGQGKNQNAPSNATVESNSSKATPAKATPANLVTIAAVLRTYGMELQMQGWYTLPSSIDQAVKKVIDGKRPGDMRPESAKKINRGIAITKNMIEATVFDRLWHDLVKQYRLVEDVKNPGQFVAEEWDFKGLLAARDQIFHQKCVSTLDLTNEAELEAFNNLPNAKIPKPDVVYGIYDLFFHDSDNIALQLLAPWVNISPGLNFPFLVIEFKALGAMQEAQLQALRAGSTLVDAHRQMKSLAKMLDLNEAGVDASNIIFSVCITPEQALLYVHWCEVANGGRAKFNMMCVKQYHIGPEDDLRKLRRDIDSILEWGVGTRFKEARDIMEKRIESTKNKSAKLSAGSSAGEASRQGQ